MIKKILLFFAWLILTIISIVLLYNRAHNWANLPNLSFIYKKSENSASAAQQNQNLSLITEPTSGIAPVISIIKSASTSIDLVMYEMNDLSIENTLIEAAKRGVKVRVLLNQGYYGVPDSGELNEQAYNHLQSHGVAVEWAPAYFALTHEKSIVVDNNSAIIMTFNFVAQFYPTSRDFGVIDRNPDDVSAIEDAFNNDWNSNQTEASPGNDLVWSPGSKNIILSLMDNAKKSLDIYNEEIADDDITNALEAAAQRGVIVRIDMTYSKEWQSAFQKLTAAGVKVRTYSPQAALYIHAKMIIADSNTDNPKAFLGSENFSYTSLTNNRELGIIFTDPLIIKSLEATFIDDWSGATAF
jgi:phosphatidylserine/phosphatidylglycerophosphate/cardiolipin synthase-like enzyme